MNSLRAFYDSTISEFINTDDETILGKISSNDSSADTRIQQKNTWKSEIEILKRELCDLDDHYSRILFEYVIPRMGKRIDNIILFNNIIFVLEFKCGSDRYNSNDYDQVYDYALDLKNFHFKKINKRFLILVKKWEFVQQSIRSFEPRYIS